MNFMSRHPGHGALELPRRDFEHDGLDMPPPGGDHGGGGDPRARTINEMIDAFHEFDEAEEAKLPAGKDGHAADAGHGVDPATDTVDELSDGTAGQNESESGVRYESAGAAELEVSGHFPGFDDFGGDPFETVFGQDDRVQVTGTTGFPWRTICKLEIIAANGQPMGCSGAMIGPRTVLTNGHCVFSHARGGWARSIRVIPGKNGASEPFGSATSTFYHSVTGWTQNASANYDYAVIVLPSNNKLGNVTGYMGLASLSFTSLMGLNVNNSGYPGDKAYGTQWWNANNVLMVTDRRLFYRLDTYAGQSGSPIWRFKDSQRHIVAVHNTGGAVWNGSVRLSKPVFDNLVKWKNMYT